jgi:hypothetical protein
VICTTKSDFVETDNTSNNMILTGVIDL